MSTCEPHSTCVGNQTVSLRLAGERLTRDFQILLLLRVDLWIRKVEPLHDLDNRCGDNKPGKPFVVSRHHVPWRVLRCGGADRLLECVHVVIPELALVNVGRRELPVLLWLFKTLHEALLLFLARHVQEELQDDGSLSREIVLEM